MTKKWYTCLLFVTALLPGYTAFAQDSTFYNKKPGEEKHTPDKISFLVYARIISDAKGNVRADENFIGNFKLTSWLKLEAGFRQGERAKLPDSYYHYKLELQTKSFWKIARIFARISDNVINVPSPSYRKTNKIIVAEAKYPLSRLFRVSAGAGYVFSSQQYHVTDALPTSQGIQSNYPVFKLALKYQSHKNGFVEIAYGSYDVFNPYNYNSPFIQLTTEQELSSLCTLYSYFRYQYAYNVFVPNNYFLCVGILFHLVKDQ